MGETFINVWHYEQWHTQNAVWPYATLTFQGWLVLTFKQHASGQQMLLVGAAVWKRQDALISQSAQALRWPRLIGSAGILWCILITDLLLPLWRGRGSHISPSAGSADLPFAKAHGLLEPGIMVVRYSNGCSRFERWMCKNTLRLGNILMSLSHHNVNATFQRFVCVCEAACVMYLETYGTLKNVWLWL